MSRKRKPPPLKQVVLYCDGGMLGGRNPSPEGVYWSVFCAPPGCVVERDETAEYHTNNDAEWLAVHAAFGYAIKYHPDAHTVQIYSDSSLICHLFNGIWRCKNTRMVSFLRGARELASRFPNVSVDWKPRRELVRRLGH
jgi:ribonuclease HI